MAIGVLFLVACDEKAPDRVQPEVSPAATTSAAVAIQSPTEVVAAYYEAAWDMRLAEAYQLISNGDRAAKTLEDFQRSTAKANERFAGAKRSFAVQPGSSDENTAHVWVDITGPDYSRIVEAAMAAIVAEGGNPDAAALEAEISSGLAAADAPRTTKRHEVVLIREDGMWRIDFDWDVARKGRTVPFRVDP